MTVIVRPATIQDKDKCIEKLEMLAGRKADPAWLSTFDALMTNERGAICIAEEDGEVLGVATMSFNLAIRYGGEYCQLEELIVGPAARGKNVGGLLVVAVIEAAKARNCAEIGLYLLDKYEGNRPFYEKYGFEFIGSEMRMRLN